MEVHHHPHVEKKSFKEYILEGLMIFLAVSMGFIAENIREYIVNREREHQYINSFYEDMKSDQKELPFLIKSIKAQQVQPADSLPRLFNNINLTTPADTIYYFLRKIIRQQSIRAYINDRTIEQIKNAGEMRLIRNRAIIDSLTAYYKDVVYADYFQQILLGYKEKLLESFPLILKNTDYRASLDSMGKAIIPDHHIYLNDSDPKSINKVLIQVSDVGSLSANLKTRIEQLIRKSQNIEKMILANYSIKE